MGALERVRSADGAERRVTAAGAMSRAFTAPPAMPVIREVHFMARGV
jgi:hypothetical protein